MNTMNKTIGITLDLVFTFFGFANLLAVGSDYRHIIAGFAGSFFVTTIMEKKTMMQKFWYALSGFSFMSYAAPAICTYANVINKSSYGVGIHLLTGIVGMALVTLLLQILDEAKGNVPKLVAEVLRLLLIKFKNWLNVKED
jgi:hypothetical protein